MDLGDPSSGEESGFDGAQPEKPRQLPDDLPTSLDDRRRVPNYGGETEMYDAWQGKLLATRTCQQARPTDS